MKYEQVDEQCVRENLNRLLGDRDVQASLFEGKGLDACLDEIFFLRNQGKSLYQRWTQRVDDKDRQLSVPNKPLKRFSEYLVPFIKKTSAHEKCHGGEIGWSPKTSLETHLPIASVLAFDLKCAFPNMSYDKIFDFFASQMPEETARFLAELCTVPYDGKRGLPQGAGFAMALFNRILKSLDVQLDEKAKSKGFHFLTKDTASFS